MNIMMLTAGEGTRLNPHTLVYPKPAIPFLNVPLFVHALRFLQEIKPTKVVFNTFHLPEVLKKTVKEYQQPFPYYFSEETKLLGSGGGLGFARNYFMDEEALILMNGDELIIPLEPGQLEKAYLAHLASGNIATLLVTENPEVGKKFGGVWVDEKNRILGFGKQPDKNSIKALHYIGVGIFSKRIFEFIPSGESNILYDNLTLAMQNGIAAQAFPMNCHWFETGNEIDFKSATWQCLDFIQKNTQEGRYLQEAIQTYSPQSEIIRNSTGILLKPKSLRVDKLKTSGHVVLNQGVSFAENITLENVIVGANVQIRQNYTNSLILS